MHKLQAKVLANRLKITVGKVVSNNQNVFIRSRQILDATLIANEAIDSRMRSTCKSSLQIAYRKSIQSCELEVSFVYLEKVGFGHKWRE